jgi:hypothetical protein
MNMTSISLSYFFLILSAFCLIFFIYFKILVMNTAENRKHKANIIGPMKNPDAWRKTNNKMSHIFLFWTIISFLSFVYIKYFFGVGLISSIYIIVFLGIMIVSIGLFGLKRKSS